MADIATNWVDNIGMIEDAAYLNALGTAVNNSTHATALGGTLGSRPAAAAGNTGAFYFCTSNGVLYKSTGSAWVKHEIISEAPSAFGDVPTTGWTGVNMQTGASWAADNDAMLFTVPTIGSTDNFQYQYITYPTAPFTLTARLEVSFQTQTVPGSVAALFGICISDGTKLIEVGPAFRNGTPATPWLDSGWHLFPGSWTNLTTYSATYNSNAWPLAFLGQIPKWYRLADNATNRTWSYSFNGIDWVPIATESRTAFLTPTRIGVAGNNYSGNGALLRVSSWKVA